MPLPPSLRARCQAHAPTPTLLLLMLLAVAAQGLPVQAASVHKCVVNGTVTYQGSPCHPEAARAAPSAEQLNAEQRKRQAQAGKGAVVAPAASADAAAPLPARPAVAPSPTQGQKPETAAAAVAATPTAPRPRPAGYRCDGRTHCSQMHSCAEAKFFLANCPGVQMDGDGNGLPCEQQWCKP